MHSPLVTLIGVSAALAFTGFAAQAQSPAQIEAATSVGAAPLDLTTTTEHVVQAARAAREARTKVSAPADDTLEPVTVDAPSPPKARVVASTSAAPLSNPDFNAADAKDKPMTTSIGSNAVAGKLNVDPPGVRGGLNRDLAGPPVRSEVGISTLF